MSGRESAHLAISTIVLSIAFGIALTGGTDAFSNSYVLLDGIRIAFIAVALGFNFHELAHRFMARKYGYSAEYFMSPLGLGIALAISFTGWIYAAPGAVRVYGSPSNVRTPADLQKTLGVISLAGPLTNIIIAAVFYGVGFMVDIASLPPANNLSFWRVIYFGMNINAWLAVFNMIPFGPLDGKEVFKWNKLVWLAMISVSALLFVYTFFLM